MINDLADKNKRKALIERYLEAETTPAEEQRLRDWFARHQAEADEREIALLVGLAAPCASCLPELDETEAEFDRLVAAGGNGSNNGGGRKPACAFLRQAPCRQQGAADQPRRHRRRHPPDHDAQPRRD